MKHHRSACFVSDIILGHALKPVCVHAGMKQLTQALDGVRIGTGPEGRGFQKREDMMNWQREGPHVDVAVNGSKYVHSMSTLLKPEMIC